MTLSFDSDMPHTASRTQHRLKQIAIRKMEHASTIYNKMDQSLPRTAEYLQQEQALVDKRRAKKHLHVTRSQRQTQSVAITEHDDDDVTRKTKKTWKKVNTAHSPDVDPVTGLTWQEKRQQRQYRRQQQQKQLTHQWAEKIDLLMEAHVPERLILPLLRKYEGDVDAILAYHAAYHQQRVAMKHRQQQQRIKKSYADTVLVRSCAAEEQMMIAHDVMESGHIRDIALV